MIGVDPVCGVDQDAAGPVRDGRERLRDTCPLDAQHDNILLGGLLWGTGGRTPTQFADDISQRIRPTAVAEQDLVAIWQDVSSNCLRNHSCPDKSEFH
ncbi:hypothetical protein D3C72_2272090 [compost metagenome]